MATDQPSKFSAADPSIGYLYQVRCALLWSLQRLKHASDFLVSVETLDDVTFESTDYSPTELLQTKHHRNSAASLTDGSSDLWKTLRIWFEGTTAGTIPDTTSFALVTTAVAPANSVASRLRTEGRDVKQAKQTLDAIAASSQSQTNSAGYAAYLSARDSVRISLLERVVVIDGAPLIVSLDSALRDEVYWAAGKLQHEAFLERLEGWWFRRVIRQLMGDIRSRIGSVEIEHQMADLREQFKAESLPIDDDILDFILDDATRAAHISSTFVRQLEIVKAGKRRIASAIRDYYRAFEQRSRWLRLELVVDLELNKYERRLVEEWQIVFEAMLDELGPKVTEAAKQTAARSVLQWAERTQFPIRASVAEPFVCRGSFHILADEARLGWHPDFRDRLSELLASGGAT